MGIMESYIIDNKLCSMCDWIYQVSILEKLCCEDYLVLIACERTHYSREIRKSLKPYHIDYYDLLYVEERAYEESIPESYHKRVCYDREQAERHVRECLQSGKPFACGRLGHSECVITYEYCRTKLGVSDYFSERFSQFLLTTSGFFPVPKRKKLTWNNMRR